MSGTVVPAEEFLSPSGKLSSPFQKGTANTRQIFLLGISIVIGGQLLSWNEGLEGGFYTFLFSTLFVGSGYVCLCLCLAEMTSILPFAGGSYGFARVTVGPYLGYLIGCCESIESIIYVPSTLLVFGKLLTTLLATSSTFEPVWWLLFYVTALTLHIGGGRVFWNFNSMIGFVSLVLIVLYCLATPAFLDYDKNVTDMNHQIEPSVANAHSPHQFMQHVHLAAWFFVGVEGMPLSCLEAKNAKVTVPRAMFMTMTVLLVTSLGILFCSASLSPGVVELASVSLPLSAGYSRAFGISPRAASLLALPGIYATGFGFMFLYGRQMCSMANSGLFPKLLAKTFGPSRTPYMALIAGSVVGYLMLLVFYFTYRRLQVCLFNICILGSFFVYLHSFASFIIFRKKFSRLHRNFTNPLGIASAVYGMFVFVIAFIGVAAFQNDCQLAMVIFIGLLALCSLYYYFVARQRQFFSAEEQSVMFVTYVIAGNVHKKLRKKRNTSGSTTSLVMSIKSRLVASSPHSSDAPASAQSHASLEQACTSPEVDLSDRTNTCGAAADFPDATETVARSSKPDDKQRSSGYPTGGSFFSISHRSRIDGDLVVICEEEDGMDSDEQ